MSPEVDKYLTLIISHPNEDLTDIRSLLKDITSLHVIHSVEAVQAALEQSRWDFILSCEHPSLSIHALMEQIDRSETVLPVLMCADDPSLDEVVTWMRLGVSGVVDRRNLRPLLNLVSQSVSRKDEAAKYRHIVNQQTELICRYNTDLQVVFVNKTYCEWQGISAEDLIGSRVTDRIPEEDRERVLAHVKSLTVANPIAVSIHQSILPDGSVRMMEWTDRAIFDKSGQLQ